MASATIYAGVGDGFVRYSNAGADSWATMRNAATGSSHGATSTADFGVAARADSYIYRAFFPFDLGSALPPGSTITAVDLKVWVSAHASAGGGTTANNSLCVVAGTQASTSTLSTSDYSAVGSTEWASRTSFASMSDGGYLTISLNATGVAAAQSAISGFFKVALRSGYDLDNVSPSPSTAISDFETRYSEYTGSSSDPHIVVTYTTSRTFTADAVVTEANPFTDAFTDTNGTNLQSHSPSTGAWSRWYDGGAGASASIQSNKARGSAGVSVAYRHSTNYLADGEINVDLTIAGTHNDGGYVILGQRGTGATPGASSGYRVLFSNGGYGTAGYIYLFKLISGSDTQLGSYNIGTLSGTYSIRFGLRGSSLSVSVNGTERITATDSAITTPGYVGIEWLRPASNGIIDADNFAFGVYTTTTRTFTADAVVSASAALARSVTADAVIKETITRTFTADAVIPAQLTRTSTADARVDGTSYTSSATRTTSGSSVTVWSAGTSGTFGAHYAFPTAIKAENGSIVAFARKATSHATYDGNLVQKVSTDGGATWGSETTIVNSAYDERDPMVRKLSSGRLILTWQQRRSGTTESYYARTMYSDDNGTTWSQPTTIATADTLEVLEPTGYAGGSVPLLVIFHAAGGTAASPFGSPGDAVISDARAAGYLVIAANAQGRAWGNDVSVGNYLAAIAYAKQHYTVTRTVFWAASMGGLPALTLASRGIITDLKGLLLIYPVCSLADFYTDKSTYRTEIDTAYQASSGQGATVAAAQNCDPYLQTTSLYTGLRFLFLASSSDTVVSKAHNADQMHSKVSSVAAESTVTSTTGDHGDASNWSWSLYSAFLSGCV